MTAFDLKLRPAWVISYASKKDKETTKGSEGRKRLRRCREDILFLQKLNKWQKTAIIQSTIALHN